MRIKEGFKLREIAGENLIVNQGASEADFTKIISLNKSARLLWDRVIGIDFAVEQVASILVEEYGIDIELATKDAGRWIHSLEEQGIIEK